MTEQAPASSPPDDAEWRLRWDAAVRAHQRGDRLAAREGYDWLLARAPAFVPGRYLSGMLAREVGDDVRAATEFDRALADAPQYIDARVARARLALDMDDAERARDLALEGLALRRDDARLWDVLGLAHLRLDNAADAVGALSQVVSATPRSASAHFNLAVALQRVGQTATAEVAYRRALGVDPAMTAARYNLAALWQANGAPKNAVAAYREVIAADPFNVNARKNLAESLLATGDIDGFIDSVLAFEATCPESLTMAALALEAYQYRGDLVGVDRVLEGIRRQRYRTSDDGELVDALETLLYVLLFFDVEPKLIFDLARVYDTASHGVYGGPLPRPTARRPGKLRIGYLSGDFRDHVMGKMMYAAIERHDRSRFALHLYSVSNESDQWTERFRMVADSYVNLAQLSEAKAASRIAEDDLDILVDLSTHTKGAKPGILVHKPARVQITHVASAGTVGSSAIDFKLTDRYADLPEDAEFQIEAPLVMDGCVYPFRSLDTDASATPSLQSLGVGDVAILLGAFVNPLKWSRRCLALWREVLERLPQARLAISPVAAHWRPVYSRLAAAAGIDASRIVVVPQQRGDVRNQARYAIVDFVLDPMPFGGVNGVLEPVAAGVPVVTLLGRRHGERSAYSILANLGVIDTVAHTARDYVDIAVRLATDAAFARSVRDAIASGLAHSTLTDGAGHTRALERAYLEALLARSPDAVAAADPSFVRA